MDKEKALKEVDGNFEYTAEWNNEDKWGVMVKQPSYSPYAGKYKGDCEDFALTVLFHIADKSWLRFFWLLISFQGVVWYCRSPRGVGHAQLWYKGKWTDNIHPTWSAKSQNTRVFPWPWPIVFFRLASTGLPRWLNSILLPAIMIGCYYLVDFLISLV